MAMYPYLQQFQQGISSQNGQKLAQLLRKNALSPYPNPNKATYGIESILEKMTRIDDYCSGQLQSPYDEFLAHHFKGVLAITKKNYIDGYNHQANLMQAFLKLFQADTSNWTLPVLCVLSSDLRALAKLGDAELRKKNMKEEKLEDAARILNSCFSICFRDGSAGLESKKFGTVHIINNLFKIYFALNNLRLCKNLIRPIEGKGFPPLSSFPVGQVVTYRFYAGRIAMFEGQFTKAEQELSEAFRRCTRRNQKNKRMILLFLIPVKLLLGKMASPQLLNQYNMTQFTDITKAVQSGNLKLLNDSLLKHQDYFIQKGVYLILEKSKILAYRNLFKKICYILGGTKFRLQAFERAFNWMGVTIDIDEIECILANLIYNGFIKGYISHQAGCLVVSGKNAFPALSAVLPALHSK